MPSLPSLYTTPSAKPLTPGALIVGPVPTSSSWSVLGCAVWNRHRKEPVTALRA
jgi:hypothetical protein